MAVISKWLWAKPTAKPTPHHPDNMIGRNIGTEYGTGDSPPAGFFSGEEVIFRTVLLSSHPQAHGHHRDERTEENDQVRGGEQRVHGSEVNDRSDTSKPLTHTAVQFDNC